MKNSYYSQHKQDFILDQIIFKEKQGGFFLDIGANDGITYSNTYFVEKSRQWKGICVEPLPDTYQKLQSNRKCILENCAVGAVTKKEIFLEISGYPEMLSGLKKNYNEQHLLRIDSEIEMYGGSKREIEISCMNTNELLKKHGICFIDYCNIDTEGSELEILRSINFRKIKINVITVEANYRMERIKMKFFLGLKGYKYVTNLGNDMLFVHRRLRKDFGDILTLKNSITKLIEKP